VRRRLARWKRIAATGVAFSTFGIAGLVCGVLVLPIVRDFPGSPRERDFRCQALVHRVFRFFVWWMQFLGISKFTIHGAERLQQEGQLVVANHPTLIDAVVIMSLMPHADCVMKSAITTNPFMGSVARCTGYLSNELEGELVDACVERLRSGRSLLLFPEGTRSPRDGLGPFQRGAAHVAFRSGAPFRPVVVRCEPPTLMRGQKWYEIPERPFEVTVECCDPIYVEAAPPAGRGRGAAARRATAELRDFFAKRLQTPRG